MLDDEALLLCESIESDPASCIEPIFRTDAFLVLDAREVVMAEQDGVRYSLEKVQLVQTDPNGVFAAVRLKSDT